MRQCRRSTPLVNPLFLFLFFGTAAASAISAITSLLTWQAPSALWLLIGGFFYLLGSFVVTILCNVPLNKALASVPAESVEGLRLWARYLSRWTAWIHVRTILSLAATAAFILASGQRLRAEEVGAVRRRKSIL